MQIAIIDDSEKDIQMIKTYTSKYFSQHFPDVPLIIHEYLSGETFLMEFSQSSYDIIFIDCYMEKLSGLDTARFIRKIDVSVLLIFITASPDFAIDSYRVKACGYLLKPITYDDYSETMSRNTQNSLTKTPYVEFENGGNPIRVFLKDIIYCDISGHYAQIHTSDKTTRIRMTFSKLTNTINLYSEFLLCYRGCIVNMKHILRIENLAFLMTNGERIPLRKREQNDIIKTYSNFLFEKVRNHNI